MAKRPQDDTTISRAVVGIGVALATYYLYRTVRHAKNLRRSFISRNTPTVLNVIQSGLCDVVPSAELVLSSWMGRCRLVSRVTTSFADQEQSDEGQAMQDVIAAYAEHQAPCLEERCGVSIGGSEPDVLMPLAELAKCCEHQEMTLRCIVVLTVDGSCCRVFRGEIEGRVRTLGEGEAPTCVEELFEPTEKTKLASSLTQPQPYFGTKQFMDHLQRSWPQVKGPQRLLLTPRWRAYLALGDFIMLGEVGLARESIMWRTLKAAYRRCAPRHGAAAPSEDGRQAGTDGGKYEIRLGIQTETPEQMKSASDLADSLGMKVVSVVSSGAKSLFPRLLVVSQVIMGESAECAAALYERATVFALYGCSIGRLKLSAILDPSNRCCEGSPVLPQSDDDLMRMAALPSAQYFELNLDVDTRKRTDLLARVVEVCDAHRALLSDNMCGSEVGLLHVSLRVACALYADAVVQWKAFSDALVSAVEPLGGSVVETSRLYVTYHTSLSTGADPASCQTQAFLMHQSFRL